MTEWDTDYRKLSSQWNNALLMTTLNHRLYDNLIHSISWLLKYAKDNNIILPNKHELVLSMEESQKIMDRIADNREVTRRRSTDDDPESNSSIVLYYAQEKSRYNGIRLRCIDASQAKKGHQ